MEERIIKHPLKNIVFQYDETKLETIAEKKLIEAYLIDHNNYYPLMAPCSKLIYEYKEQRYKAEDILKKLIPVTQTIDRMYTEAVAIMDQNKEEILSFLTKQSEYYSTIHDFHVENIDPLAEEQNKLDDAYFDLEEKSENLQLEDSEFDRLESICWSNKEYETYSLDIISLNDDKEKFFETIDKIELLNQERNSELKLYNSVMKNTSATYEKVEEIKKLINQCLNDTGDLDSSVSDSFATGKGDETKKPFYLLAPGDKKVTEFKSNYGLLAHSSSRFLNISVSEEVLNSLNPGHIEHLIICLQHFPKLIEKMAFSLDVFFEDADGIKLPTETWLGHEPYIHFLSVMDRLPCAVFFFSDRNVRSYILMGSLIRTFSNAKSENNTILFEGENLEALCNRVYTACWFMMVFCYNTGFDPKEIIQTLLDELELEPITYEMVRKNFDDDLIKGIQIKAIPVVRNEDGTMTVTDSEE